MTRLLTVSLGCLAYMAVAAAQSTDATQGSVERAFASGGSLSLDLSAGDYRISGAQDQTVRVAWQVDSPDEARHVKVDADVTGTRARIKTDGPSRHFRVRIQVPSRADLVVRLSAGDLTVRGVSGNKDVELHAGDLNIDMGKADDYNRVDASVWAGDLNIEPLKVSKGGLFRSYEWKGKGPYSLRAHLKAGDLRIY